MVMIYVNKPIYIGGTYQRLPKQGVKKMPAIVSEIIEYRGQRLVLLNLLDGRITDCLLEEFNEKWELVKK